MKAIFLIIAALAVVGCSNEWDAKEKCCVHSWWGDKKCWEKPSEELEKKLKKECEAGE